MSVRALTILNETGDVTITWEPENDERMLALIEKKMKDGFAFFLIEPRMGGVIAPDKSKQLKKSKDALKHRALSMRDEDFESLVSEGKADLVKTPETPARTVKRSRAAREVVARESVAVRPMAGG